ncbi:hypothetical protein [Halobacteriovorax sp. HLS]|uniref:golvesin C-terminal-like domain-containing protein n=1 Tax=Halobacteriovorax sp. HLS TaxID=2234000 RepID=UPI000FD7CF12|nr:hypothetical protein [Halobacteriovorax sp. HLS]
MMLKSSKVKIFLMLILCLGVLTSCKSDEEAIVDAVNDQINPPGNTDPIKPDPTDPPSGPILGKNRVIIGNYFDPESQSPKKDSKGYSQEGNWIQSSLTGHKNSISRYSLEADARVSYETSKLGQDKYCVSVFQVAHSNSESDVLVKLFDDGNEIFSKSIDYREGGGWVHLGEFDFAGEKKSQVTIERGVFSNGGALRADEVRFSRVKDGFDCLGRKFANIKKGKVFDNKFDPSISKPKRDSVGLREVGTWYKSSLAGFKDSISRYSRDENAYVTYSANVQESSYCLKVYRVTHPNSASRVKIQVMQESLIEEYFLDYSLNEDQKGWVTLGNVNFDTTKPVVVKISKDQGDSGVLRSDALRFQKKSCE